MKTVMQTIANRLEMARMNVMGFAKAEARRFMTDNRGMTTVETVALTVVIAGAVVAGGAVLNTLVPDLFTDLFDRVKELLGL